MKNEELLKQASQALKNAYAPYSKFKVGCAVVGGSGKVYTGCNVENASYGATICAERVAITMAVAHGEKTIEKLALVTSSDKPCPPCGMCLQVIAEFGRNAEIIMASNDLRATQKFIFKDLLPQAYSADFLP